MNDALRNLLHGNQFLSGGLLLGLLGGATVLGRRYLIQFGHWLWTRCTVSVEIRNTDVPFEWLVIWLDQQPYSKRARRLTVSVVGKAENGPAAVGRGRGKELPRPNIVFSPSVGNHLVRHGSGGWLWIHRTRQDAAADKWGSIRDRESFSITMLGQTQEPLRRLLNEAYDAYEATVREQSRVFASVWSQWHPQGFVRPRSLESVILPGQEKQALLADLHAFLGSEDWYQDMGIPYRRGYLLHGVSGSGKSSLVTALAGAVGMHLYVVNLASLSDSDLLELLSNVGSLRAIILFEDIDSVAKARSSEAKGEGEQDSSQRGTLSGLLNALDGVASRDGYITVLTTNRRELLDPRLLRPGRVDMEIEFGYATAGQALALYERFYGPEAAARHGWDVQARLPAQVSMASLQEYFLRYRDDPTAGAELQRLRSEARSLKVVGADA